MKLSTRLTAHPPLIYRWLYPGAVWRLDSGDDKDNKVVYLTFDDGPTSLTPFILETLKSYGAKATFFVVGDNCRSHPQHIKRILLEGHSLGNHTMHHLQGLKCDLRSYMNDIGEEEKLLETRLFRPPHGFMKLRQYLELRKRYRIVMFDVVSLDYRNDLKWEDCVKIVQRYTRNGSVIVFHDSLKAFERMRYALPEALKWLTEEGYELRSLPMD